MLALIGNLDTTELIVVFVAAILIFGRKLPQVAAQAGTQLGKLRRTLDSAWKDSGVDKEVREMQRSIESIRDAVPRDLSPGTLARTAATEFQRRVERKAADPNEAYAPSPSPESPAQHASAPRELEPPAPPSQPTGPTGWSAPGDASTHGHGGVRSPGNAAPDTLDPERPAAPPAGVHE